MRTFNRRTFLKSSLLAAASIRFFPALTARAGGANDEVRFAVVGFNQRGTSHIGGFSKIKGTRLVALCDVDRDVLDREVKKCQTSGNSVEGYSDVRKLLENPNIDVVTFATPNHWHSLGSIWAVQAGKDVYVEKPVSHNVWEGRQLVSAARKHGRLVQAGTQSRSRGDIREAIQWTQEGHIGKLLRARGLCYKRRPTIGKVSEPQPTPESVDYDLWCGPAPKEPLMRKKLHYDWHWVWPTGNGDLGNQGVHQVDVARWVLGEAALSPRVLSIGGRLGYDDDGTTPNTLIVFHDYPAAPLIFEVRGLPSASDSTKMDKYRGASIGVVADFEGGSLVIPDSGAVNIVDKDGAEIKKFSKGSRDHFGNFIEAVRSRKQSDLNADILEGHISSALCHTANISYRLGKKRTPEQIRGAIRSNKDMDETFGRMEQHLAANMVDLRKTPATIGAVLKMDPQAERFVGSRAANNLLTRKYRAPFVVPEKV